MTKQGVYTEAGRGRQECQECHQYFANAKNKCPNCGHEVWRPRPKFPSASARFTEALEVLKEVKAFFKEDKHAEATIGRVRALMEKAGGWDELDEVVRTAKEI